MSASNRIPGAAAVVAAYRVGVVGGEDPRRRALDIAREQTLEVPSGAAPPDVEERFLGRVLSVHPDDAGGGTFRAEIAYGPELFDGSLTQLLNVVWGNVSLMDHVRLVDLDLSADILATLPGPRFGIPGIREMVGGVRRRPLVSSALKPVGLGVDALADIAVRLTRAGVDVIKDDHGLADQATAPFRERVRRIADAVRDANDRGGTHAVYFPQVTGPVERLTERVTFAREEGCPGVVLCPGLVGLDTLRALVEGDCAMAVMAHPSHAGTSPASEGGIAPDLLMGTLWRLAGADAVVYVNARGRFSWPVEACQALNRRAREPLGTHRPAFPVPAGGIQAADVGHWFETYGNDTLLLIGGSLLEAPDVEAAARAVVEAAQRAGEGGHA
jgi:ribulose-bisphosphate carboxylase large chain